MRSPLRLCHEYGDFTMGDSISVFIRDPPERAEGKSPRSELGQSIKNDVHVIRYFTLIETRLQIAVPLFVL